MVVIILEKASRSLRGELSRFLLEPQSGVFVGKISALVREELWLYCIKSSNSKSVIQIWSDNNEQGFSIRTHGASSREIRNYEGLSLVTIPDDSHAVKVRKLIAHSNSQQ